MERHNRIIQEALNWIGILILITAMIFAFACVAAFAQDTPQGDPQTSPDQAQQAPADNSQQAPDQPAESPSQPAAPADNQNSVARASFVRGDVAMQRGDSGTWSAVTLNTPLMAGDRVSTGDASRTEVQLDFANILRLDNNSQADLATLSSNRIQVQVAQGVADYSVLKGTQADAEIDTPNVAVHPLGPGRYGIRILPDGDSEIAVREGDADVSTSEGSTTVHRGQMITVHGMGTDAQYKITDAPASDEFDAWNRDRDDIIYNAQAYQHLNHYYTGAGDMDAYGTWTEVPDYGSVWIPTEPVGWAPYRVGTWVWEPYWGWTWASYEPWGWAPYHYGRWFLYGNAWAWWPGPVFAAYRPIWAPAYVGFFGFGGGFGAGFGFGFGFGSIGWLPTGPCDYFHPWWGGFRDGFGVLDVNRGIGFRGGIAPLHDGLRYSNFNVMLASNRMRAGVSSVAAGSFGRGPVASRAVSLSELRGSRMMTGNVPVVPTRDSLRTTNLAVGSAARASAQQHFFSMRAPAARQESFSAAASRMQQSMQRGGESRGFAAGGANGNAGLANRSRTFGGAAPSYRSPVAGATSQGRAPNLEGQGSDVWHSFSSSRSGSASRAGAQPSYRGAQPSMDRNSGASRTFQAQGGAQSGWQRFTSQSRGNSYRPPLDMSKPVVNPRSYSGAGPYGGGPSYRGGSSPAYRGGPSPAYRGGGSPAYGGGAPSRPSYGGPGGRYRAPSPTYRGGGPSFGGGGSRSFGGGPSFGGGSGRSFGGGSRSFGGGGGGGHFGGGGHGGGGGHR